MVRDGNLFNSFADTAEFRSHFGAEFETLAFQLHPSQEGAAEDFVACGLVVDSCTIQKICEVSEKLRAEKETHSALGTVWAHSIDHVGLSFSQRSEQGGIIAGVVLEIGILDKDIFAASVLECGTDRSSFATVHLVEDDGYVALGRECLEFFTGAIGRSIINDNDFFFDRRVLHCLQKFR